MELIFQPSDLRCSIDDMIRHPWVNNHGALPEITRHPLRVQSSVLKKDILDEMEKLGFARGDVTKAVLEGRVEKRVFIREGREIIDVFFLLQTLIIK